MEKILIALFEQVLGVDWRIQLRQHPEMLCFEQCAQSTFPKMESENRYFIFIKNIFKKIKNATL